MSIGHMLLPGCHISAKQSHDFVSLAAVGWCSHVNESMCSRYSAYGAKITWHLPHREWV